MINADMMPFKHNLGCVVVLKNIRTLKFRFVLQFYPIYVFSATAK